VTIYNGVDVTRFPVASVQATAQARRAIGMPVGVPLVGSLGRLHPQKGFSDLLTAFAQVRQRVSSVRLFVAGDGELRDDLEAQARSLGIAAAVTFAGVRADVSEILAALDVFVLPSLWEGMPNAVLEAMAAGLPVVATAVGGTPEVVVDRVTGLLVPPQDPGALARAIERLLRDPGLRRTMGRAGRRRVERHFHIQETVRQVQDLYEALLRDKAGFLNSAAVGSE
jgi:glycosyltransferase involved in cell wall biosynthesis